MDLPEDGAGRGEPSPRFPRKKYSKDFRLIVCAVPASCNPINKECKLRFTPCIQRLPEKPADSQNIKLGLTVFLFWPLLIRDINLYVKCYRNTVGTDKYSYNTMSIASGLAAENLIFRHRSRTRDCICLFSWWTTYTSHFSQMSDQPNFMT